MHPRTHAHTDTRTQSWAGEDMAGRDARRQRAVHGKLVRAMTRLLERVESLRRRKCQRYIHPSRAEEDARTLNGERDHVFIGNQREQLQKEPAQVPSCRNRAR